MVKTVADLNAEIDAQFNDNHSRSITPAKQRAVLKDIVTNIPVTAGQVLADAGTPSNTTYLRGDNTWNTPPGGSSSSITGGGLGFKFASLTDAMATSLDSGVQWFETAGFAAAGDKGDGLYAKLTSDPAWATNEPNPSGAISGRNAGVPQTEDGAFWLLIPRDGKVKPTQFGAKVGRDFNDATLDQWPFFEDTIWYIVNQGYEAGLTMFVPSSWYYQTKPMTMHGGQFNVEGSGGPRDGSVLWWPHTTHGTIVGYCEGGWATIDAEGGPYNGNFAGLFVGDTRYNIGGDNHVYVCTVAGIPGGWNATLGQWASPPTGTGSDIVDGTVHWAYQRELTRLEKLAILNGRAGGGIVKNVETYCGTDWQTGNIRSNHTGIVARNRIIVENVFSASWPGCDIAFCSDGDNTFRGGSNCDGWRADHIVCYWSGQDGLHIGNSKSNAGTLIDGDFATNGRSAIYNGCFLDNSITSIQCDGDGTISHNARAQYAHGVCYNGRFYIARMPIGGLEGGFTVTSNSSGNFFFGIYQSPAPDVSSYWIYTGGDGTWSPNTDFPTWSNTGLYEPGGSLLANNFNDRTVITKFYQESGSTAAQFMPNNLILGGLLQWGYGGTVWNDRKWTQPLSVADAGVNTTTGVAKNIQYTFGTGAGGGWSQNAYPKRLWAISEYEGTVLSMEGSDTTRFDQTSWDIISLATNGFSRTRIERIGTLNSVDTWGAAAAKTCTRWFRSLIIGDAGALNDGREMFTQWENVAPNTTNRAKGDIAWNGDGGSGDPIGWKWNGTAWKSMGTLA